MPSNPQELSANAKRFDFDGEQLTVREIRERVPVLGDGAVRRRLAAGINTKMGMLSFDGDSARRANGRKAARRALGRAMPGELTPKLRTQRTKSGDNEQ